jgi:general stress protein YciG
MTPEKRRMIAQMGGKAAQRMGVAHQWTHKEAVAAGRKGGTASSKKRQKSLRGDR